MKEPSAETPGLDVLMDRLEELIGYLADPNAPLDRLVTDFEEATRLIEAAQKQLAAAGERIEQMQS